MVYIIQGHFHFAAQHNVELWVQALAEQYISIIPLPENPVPTKQYIS